MYFVTSLLQSWKISGYYQTNASANVNARIKNIKMKQREATQ